MKTLPNDIFFAEVERLLSDGKNVILTVQGNSMRPFIRSGRTKAVLSSCNPAMLKKGDTVLFRYRGHHILHRIIKRTNDDFVLAGDGNYKRTETCRTEDIVAKMITVIGHNGCEIGCDSRLWRCGSWCWTSLHPFIRRCILALFWRIGIR